MTMTEWFKSNDDPNNIFAPPMDAQTAIWILCDYLLSEKWVTPNPISQEQINTEIVCEILGKYSKKYQKEMKEWQK